MQAFIGILEGPLAKRADAAMRSGVGPAMGDSVDLSWRPGVVFYVLGGG